MEPNLSRTLLCFVKLQYQLLALAIFGIGCSPPCVLPPPRCHLSLQQNALPRNANRIETELAKETNSKQHTKEMFTIQTQTNVPAATALGTAPN